jgi:hypothetical protein
MRPAGTRSSENAEFGCKGTLNSGFIGELVIRREPPLTLEVDIVSDEAGRRQGSASV